MPAYSVSDINRYIKTVVSGDFALHGLVIAGEISNYKPHPSGHVYFTLKDSGSQLRCVMWKSDTYSGIRHRMADGQKVLVSGDITVYEAGGYYQLQAKNIELAGIGDLYAEFEKRKQKLAAEGLFDPEHKLPIPKFPRTVGIVTARQGDALRDIVSTLKRRNPYVQPILCPAKVQGDGAVQAICHAIRVLEAKKVDLILVCRGGGSIEDLWAFNEEMVARCVYDCTVPIISGVGHEPDVTIIDYVSDRRAPTPTGAAEMAVLPVSDTEAKLVDRHAELTGAMAAILERLRERVTQEARMLSGNSPEAVLKNQRESVNALRERLVRDMTQEVSKLRERTAFSENKERMRRQVLRLLAADREKADEEETGKRMLAAVTRNVTRCRELLISGAGRLEAVSPLQKISCGYGYLTGKEGSAVRSVTDVSEGDEIRVYLRDGSISANVTEVTEQKTFEDAQNEENSHE